MFSTQTWKWYVKRFYATKSVQLNFTTEKKCLYTQSSLSKMYFKRFTQPSVANFIFHSYWKIVSRRVHAAESVKYNFYFKNKCSLSIAHIQVDKKMYFKNLTQPNLSKKLFKIFTTNCIFNSNSSQVCRAQLHNGKFRMYFRQVCLIVFW